MRRIVRAPLAAAEAAVIDDEDPKPEQVLLSASTIANDGKLMEPTILREIRDGEDTVIRSFTPNMRWDLTRDAVIQEYVDNTIRGCIDTGNKKTVQPWVFEKIQEGMRLAVLEGTLANIFRNETIAVAGKTGTAEYCDNVAQKANRCQFGSWPTHSWTLAYAPYDDPEIIILAFCYNGGEGASVAAPIVGRVMQAYFELKAIDLEKSGGG